MAALRSAGAISLAVLMCFVSFERAVADDDTLITIPKELLKYAIDNPGTDWCAHYSELPKCANNGQVSFMDVLEHLQEQTGGDLSKIDWCHHWFSFLFPWCKSTSTSTTTPTTTPSNTTATTTRGHHTTGTGTTAGQTTHRTPKTTTQKPPHTTTAKRHTTGTTGAPSNTTSIITTAHPTKPTSAKPITTTTPSSGAGDKFSVEWFFVGFAVMLGVAIIIVILVVVCKKCRGRTDPNYSLLTA